MTNLSNIITDKEINKYKEEWENFNGRYKVNTPYNVHNGIPVISEVYQFDSKPVFRAHVFSKRLRKIDPYNIAKKCIQPFWHALHYLIAAEQMYTASSKLLIGEEYHKMVAKDIPVEFRWKKPLFWSDNVSIEFIRLEDGKIGRYDKQTGHFTFYSDKTGRILSRMTVQTYWEPRTYVKLIEALKKGNTEALNKLFRIIEAQDRNQKRKISPRRTLSTTKEELIGKLNNNEIPERELDDFFSLWDKI